MGWNHQLDKDPVLNQPVFHAKNVTAGLAVFPVAQLTNLETAISVLVIEIPPLGKWRFHPVMFGPPCPPPNLPPIQ